MDDSTEQRRRLSRRRDGRAHRALAGLLLFGTVSLAAGEAVPAIDPRLHRLLETERAWAGVPGLAVAALRDGRVVAEGVLGVANVELGVPMTRDVVVPLSSTTKIFTGVVALRAALDDRWDLDAPIDRYLPSLPSAWQAVSVRQLLGHLSGLPEVLDCPTPEREEAWACLRVAPVLDPPGARFRYNQTNYFLVLEILERLYGEPFPELVRRRVLDPAGMGGASFSGSDRDVVPGRATSYYADGSGGLRHREFEFPEFLLSAAGLNASLRDLERFEAALAGGRLLPLDRLAALWSEPQLLDGTVSSYGLGWDVRHHPSGERSAGHEGGGLTTFRRFLGHDVTVIVLANGARWGFDPDRVALRVADLVAPGTANMGERLASRMRSSLLGGDLNEAIALFEAEVWDGPSAPAGAERAINRLGYELLERARSADAVAILRLNVEAYPASANAHDSLGDALTAVGDARSAIESYRASLRLDPSNDHAADRIRELDPDHSIEPGD